MNEQKKLQWILIRRFIEILFLVGVTEYLLMSVLNNLALPVVYDYFTLNGTDYMVTEYVVGTSVEEAFEKREHVPYSTDELMEIMEPLLEGIQ